MLFDEPQTLSTSAVLDWHALCAQGLSRERQRCQALLTSGAKLPSSLASALAYTTSAEIEDYFRQSLLELDLVADFVMISGAEARIRMDAEQRQRRRSSNVMAGRLSVLYANAPHSWGVRLYDGGIMDAWKDLIGNLSQISSNERARMRSSIGRFKEALVLRHWIAHGRYWNLIRGVETFPPVTVAMTIDGLYATLATVAKIDGLMDFH